MPVRNLIYSWKYILFMFIFFPLLFTGCKEEETIHLNLNGTLNGHISAYDEFGHSLDDNDNILVKLVGTNPLVSTLTDQDGYYEFLDVLTATYSLELSKEGYTTNSGTVPFIGGEIPLNIPTAIFKTSQTVVSNLSLEVVEGNLNLQGTITYSHESSGTINIPVSIYISDNPDVSKDKYDYSTFLNLRSDDVASGADFNLDLGSTDDFSGYSPGTTLYMRVYGGTSFGSGIISDGFRARGGTTGEPSDVISFVL